MVSVKRTPCIFKNLWDITALNFLSINEDQLKRYGEANDLDVLLFDRDVKG